ncbi:MAG: hypothetical protein UR12_C0025G0018 [candidate division TM6 bacterium GW2011_GWF2_30_66]|nr:MAG: hypothetical protein UR12_C0025G0018 [candidate division TM6 bacterium GW2011_GWF2_30_66]
MKFLENIPETIKGVILMVCGFALLLNTLGVLADILWYVLIAISLYLIFIGFVKVKGVELVKSMLDKKNIVIVEVEKTEDKDK